MPPTSSNAIAFAVARWARAGAKLALWLVLGAWSLVLMAWLTLHWGILPHAQQWRPQIEQRASQALGLVVRIGHIDVQSRGWIPAVALTDVVLHDAQGREALRLPRVAAAVSARSLLTFELRFEQLLIEGAQLDVRREADGRIHIAGLDVTAPASGDDGAMADWFFRQHEFVIRNGTLRWTDAMRDAPPLLFSGVDFVARNGLRRHEMRLDATPPPEWGERFSLRGRFVQPVLARAGDWRRWRGTVHAQLPRADVATLQRHVTLPFDLSAGVGTLRAWVDVAGGEARAATVDLALRDVAMQLADDVPPLELAQVDGRLTATRHADGDRFEAEQFGFVTADGVRWPAGSMKLALLRADPAQAIDGGEFSADQLDLALMSQVAERVPIGSALRSLLAQLAPRGRVEGLHARWQGPLDAPRQYEVRSRMRGLSIAAAVAETPDAVGRPGWHNADIEFSANHTGGRAQLVIADGAVELPGVFENPVVLVDDFSAQLAWRIETVDSQSAPRLSLTVQQARFANADAEGELAATWHTGEGDARFPGVLDLSGRLSRGRATAVARYLPRDFVETRQYLDGAVLDGRVDAANFRLRGDLREFPFVQRRGEFHVSARLSGGTLAYVPGEGGAPPQWPAFHDVSGELVFDRNAMEIRNARARLWGIELSRVNGRIDDLDDATLAIDGRARGPASDLVHFVNRSPVGGWIGGALDGAQFGGRGDLALSLSLPLSDIERSTVKGSVTLPGNDVRFSPDTPLLANTRARVDFTEDGFTLHGGSARVLGGDVGFEGGSGADGRVRITAQGLLTADALRHANELGPLARLAGAMRGQAAYRLSLGFGETGGPEFVFTSSLLGFGLDLPAPLAKSPDQAMPLRVSAEPLAGAPQREQWRFELGQGVQAHYVRELDATGAPRMLRGGIGVGAPMPAPAQGVHANVRVAQLNADAWQALLEQALPGAGGAESRFLPDTVAFRADDLVAGARRITNVVAGLSREPRRWRANVSADQLDGYLEWQPAADAGQSGTVNARLARLSLPQAQAESVASLLDEAPGSAPALDIVVDDFELRGMRLGRVEIAASNRATPAGTQWELTRFTMATPEARLAASGRWAATGDAQRRMKLDFELDLADTGAFLDRMGLGGTLRGGAGLLKGQVAWSGSPLSLHVPSLDGRMNLALEGGQFLKAGAGAARLLSVLSLQSLPRRLVLDFRDVFQQGFAFDHVGGDIQIDRGVAHTNNLRMRGVQAAVLMEGAADLDRETQSLRVIVVPEINAGTASLAYAAINPAVGLTTFVAQLLLRKPLMAAGTREFYVSGTWADPKVERIERRPDAPLPEIEAPASAPSAPSQPGRHE